MDIENNTWKIQGKYIYTKILEPFWSASKVYGWSSTCEGFGISEKALEYAKENFLGLRIEVPKRGIYQMEPSRIQKTTYTWNAYRTKSRVKLRIIPRVEFDRIVNFMKESDKMEDERQLLFEV